MATNEFLRESLNHYKQQEQRLLNDLRSVRTTIRQIQVDLGETPEAQSDLSATSLEPEAIKPPIAGKGPIYHPRPDEFFTLSQAEAAKMFLEKIGHAISTDELVNGLKEGGCKVGGVDPKRTLYVSLTNAREFVPVGNGFIGLRSFYPKMPKLGRPKNGGEKRKRSLAKRVSKKGQRKKLTPVAAKTPPPIAINVQDAVAVQDAGGVKVAIREILSDHVARTLNDVLLELENRLGHPVKKIAVYGTLRKKDFEQVGEKYRLRPSAPEAVVLQ